MRTIIYEEPQSVELTDRQKAILNALKKGPLNRQQLMDKIGITITDRGMQLELAKLKKLGLIKPEGKGKALVLALIE